MIVEIDFETYSEAGFVFSNHKWQPLSGASERGLPAIGAAVYSEHHTTEVLSLAYNLNGIHVWQPGSPLPVDLFTYIQLGGILEAWNCAFERWIWQNVCVPKYGFPELPFNQLFDAAAKSRAFGLPGKLADSGNVLNVTRKKDEDGKRLIRKFSIPRNPTKLDKRLRIQLSDDLEDTQRLIDYNKRDIEAEKEISDRLPNLSTFEHQFWLCDQAINYRGVQLDKTTIENGIKIVDAAIKKYNQRLNELTNNAVQTAGQIKALKDWINANSNLNLDNLQSETIEQLLSHKEGLPSDVLSVLEIRQRVSSAAIKKLFAMSHHLTKDNRVHDLFIYHGARTGRATGSDVQPTNLPNHGPVVFKCDHCGHHYKGKGPCRWCDYPTSRKAVEWNPKAVEDCIQIINSGSLAAMEYYFDDALAALAGCLRGLFISKPGHDLICSDYHSIEAVVLAAIAGEEWRLEVFRTHGKIYEMSASKITGIPFHEFITHIDGHHPMRKLGKVAELASGYQGWIGAWKNFGADDYFQEEEMKQHILAWRNASPAIVRLWHSLQAAAVAAISEPGKIYEYRGIQYIVVNDILYCRLLSGRFLYYHKPRLVYSEPEKPNISFETWNTNPKYGKPGWVRMDTYGGKLTENIVQATARDIFAWAVVNLEKAGYPIVLHVYDEICAEIPENWGSLEEFERIMVDLPAWCKDWPIKASGGWREKRYRK
jgi:DNA polymerase bacteriophage-type